MGPGDGQTVANPARGGLTYKARSGQTGGALTAWESTAAPGEGPPLHLHVNEDEFMYVLEGRLRFRLDENDHTAPAGSFVFIPRGVPHTWQNAGDGHARILFLFTPGVARHGALLRAVRGTSRGQTDGRRLRDACERRGHEGSRSSARPI
jgi:quercetin dioxygenase-like cupin family protein